jgi:hypothetical protein
MRGISGFSCYKVFSKFKICPNISLCVVRGFERFKTAQASSGLYCDNTRPSITFSFFNFSKLDCLMND